MNDQPFTCPYCGLRCWLIGDFIHTNARLLVQECGGCGFICGEVDDED